jgi:hypothetical protein
MASRKQHELYFKVDNRVAVSTVASKTRCFQDLAVGTHGSHSDLVRACALATAICFYAARCY